MTKKDKIIHGNIIIIHIDDVEPSMAIIPKIDFQKCKISDIFKKIEHLHKQFPNCNFKHTSLTFEDKYKLYSHHRNQNMSLTNWFHHRHISKDANNNYIFYVEESRGQKKAKQTKKKKSKLKKKNNKSQKEKYSENI
jgi:hypothetical protein